MQDALLQEQEHAIRLPDFEGPLDLLLYLIQRNELDIYDIPIETVTRSISTCSTQWKTSIWKLRESSS